MEINEDKKDGPVQQPEEFLLVHFLQRENTKGKKIQRKKETRTRL